MISILPDVGGPRLAASLEPPSLRELRAIDAVVVMVPADVGAAQLGALPEPARWRGLHARSIAVAGTVRSTTLTNERQTLAVLGYLKRDASAFERLSLAGKLLKETAAREPESLAILTLVAGDGARLSLDALLEASFAQAFGLPSQRKRPAKPARTLGRILLVDAGGRSAAAGRAVARATAAARGNNLARWLTALPANVLDASAYRAALVRLARDHGLAFRWFDERALKRLGANAFLAVSAGNAERTAGIARLCYVPGPRRRAPARRRACPDVALVGKGVLFDTGGLNLKPHRGMLDMHIDMAGSAVALATLLGLAELRAPIRAEAWLAITENRTGPTAYRPQDIVTAANGVSIQVVHTDAEGRMVLADTLAMAGRERPRLMIDFGTLTGACVYALTERMSGVFTNEARLVEPLLAAGRASGERVWNFPMDEDFDSDIESKVADVLQCPLDGKGDHILAARFLQRFVPAGTAWAHVDLAAAERSGGLGHIGTDITGFGVRYTLELLLGQRILERVGASA